MIPHTTTQKNNSWFVRLGAVALAAFLLIVAPFSCMAAPAQIDIYGPSQRIVTVAMADPLAEGGKNAPAMGQELNKLIRENLYFLPFVRMVTNKILGGTRLAGYNTPNIDFKRFEIAGADYLITSGWVSSDTVQLRVFETMGGNLVLGRAYTDVESGTLVQVADKFCAEFMRILTGHGEFFLSTLAFVKNEGENRNLWTARPTGRSLKKLTNMTGIAMSPSWSSDARFIIFSHINKTSHALGVWDSRTGQTQRVKFPGNTVIGPTFMPDNKVAVSLAQHGYPNIYLLNHSFKRERVLEDSGGIDVSPSFDATGTKMAFTSSRLGNPHVFLKDMPTGQVRRVSQNGTYNTEPSISPDGTLVAFSRMTDKGFRIFVYDVLTGEERQVSFGPGRDEQPSFAPDSYFLAFVSNRSGKKQIYLTTRHGGEARLVPTGNGEVFFPAWGNVADWGKNSK